MSANPRPDRTLDALPDTVDFRDTLYIPSLIGVRSISDIDGFRDHRIPVLDQGREGACTGFGLATVANYLLRVRGLDPKADEVSAWMLYTMARRYDEWPGEEYSGSSARGAMKGWHKHGVCAKAIWRDRARDATLNESRAADALKRPLGAYFRVNHKDLVAMHAAISEVGVLFATARVHTGWQAVQSGDLKIKHEQQIVGGHAFAIVGYNNEGFWIQNSWGSDWGAGGIALVSYADWLANGTDVWVAALGAPVDISRPAGSARMMAGAPRSYQSEIYASLRPYIVACKNNGLLESTGEYGLTEKALREIVGDVLPNRVATWARKRVVLYAHGGLVSEKAAVQTVANNRQALLDAEIYPLSFIWRSDAGTTLGNILKDAIAARRDEGVLDRAKDFMLDRLDDTLEPTARLLGGKALWDEMKENARGATTNKKGGARLTADLLIDLYKNKAIDEIHLVGHSAGAIFLAPLAEHLVKGGLKLKSVTLWAPACTMDVFEETYRPLAESGDIEGFDLYTLHDTTEQDDNCANIYNKSLLYLVGAALEHQARIPWFREGTPILGMEKFATAIPDAFWRKKGRNWFKAPGLESKAVHHGDFDNDGRTLQSTLDRITGEQVSVDVTPANQALLTKSPVAQRQFRLRLDEVLQR